MKNEIGANFCSGCGEVLSASKNSSKKFLITGVLVCLVTLGGIGYGFKESFFAKDEAIPVIEELKTLNKQAPVAEIETKKVAIQQKDKTKVIQETMPKVFTILTEVAQGSGFLYEQGGYIVTNAHVVAGYTDVIVRNSAGKDSSAKVIGISDKSDVALLISTEYAKVNPLETELEESIVGTEVIALGSPQGFENSASIGYLTGVNRDIEFGFLYEHLYQIDAQIDQGSSGGPLIDAKTGKVIGINSLLFKENDVFGFSIPMNTVTSILDNWISSPMNEKQVTSLFGVYEDYTYSDENVSEDTYYEEDAYSEESIPEDTSDEEDANSDEIASYEEESVEDDWNDNSFEEESLSNFIISFRGYYEMALADEDFSWIEDMLGPGSIAYIDLEKYVYDVSGQGMIFDFTSNTVTAVEIFDDYALVSTNEEFDFTNAAGEYESYNRDKEYTVMIDSEGNYQITDIFIYE